MAQAMAIDLTAALKVHPAADLFPMMGDEDLQNLAASIAENGQLQPIMMQNGLLIDGRNRLAACKLAGVKPIFAELPKDQDPLDYIDAMDERRNVSKGQRAMVKAMRYPEVKHGGKRVKGSSLVSKDDFHGSRVSQARSVLHHSRALAESVVKGITPLDAALAKVREEQQLENSDEAQLARLQQSAPDLADQVNDERLKLDEAVAALLARQQRLRAICEAGRSAAVRLATDFSAGVSAIVDARTAGEPIRLPKGALQLIAKHYELLKKEITFNESVDEQ
jgi:hypothetical protein